jgi:hypothetical protein
VKGVLCLPRTLSLRRLEKRESLERARKSFAGRPRWFSTSDDEPGDGGRETKDRVATPRRSTTVDAQRPFAAAAAAPSNFPIGATPIYLRRCLMARSTTRILSLRPDEIIGTFVTPVTTDSLPSPTERSNKSNRVPTINARRGLRRVERTQVLPRFDQRLAFVFVLRPIEIEFIERRRVSFDASTNRRGGFTNFRNSKVHREEATANDRSGARKIERRAFFLEEGQLAGADEIIFARASACRRSPSDVDRASVRRSPGMKFRGVASISRDSELRRKKQPARVETHRTDVREVRRPRQWLRVFTTRLRFVARAGLLRLSRRRDDERRGRRRRRWKDIVKFDTLVGQRRRSETNAETTREREMPEHRYE